ncbi:6-phosphofructokinase [Acrasis kona]|uniref:Pyrophosphate--fructose 6-phosphate 1-phosphotransferase n=1 Tax=Acrasis kona TaxID=1008807 RepID=A0AAW2YYS7_9EUKA
MSTQEKVVERLGICVGGGPAPGINGVIAAVTIEAINNGLEVVGFIEGFKYLMAKDYTKFKTLKISDVSRIHFQGGSVLRTSRSNPTKNPVHLQNCVDVLSELNVKYLVTIGGDDTAFSSMSIAKAADNKIKVCHVPKTIDNDLPLPNGIPTFGYQTAREVGTNILRNLSEDAKTAGRFFIVVAMGRNAGHLALGIGKSAGAQLTIIPEEFHGSKITFNRVCDIIESTVIKRLAKGKDHGVVVLAEGLLEHMDQEDLITMFGQENVKLDPHGHILLAELDFGKQIRDELRSRASKRGISVNFTEKNLGYELRCAPPNAYDREYTRDLGYGAVSYLLSGRSGALISFQGTSMVPMDFEDIKDPKTGKARVRMVDCDSEGFKVAVKYMIRLSAKDFNNPQKLQILAQAGKTTEEEFKKQFEYLVHSEAH